MATTILAPHHHELTELADRLEGVGNPRVSVKEEAGRYAGGRAMGVGAAAAAPTLLTGGRGFYRSRT